MPVIKKVSEIPFRIVAAIISWGALLLQLYLVLQQATVNNQAYSEVIINFFSFMTILSNMLVAFVYTWPLWQKKETGFFNRPFVQSAVLVYILVVCVGYHFLLAKIWDPQGWQKLADLLLHYYIPFLYLVFWWAYVKKGYLPYRKVYSILSFPALYLLYAMVKGVITGVYPYYFLNIEAVGFSNYLAAVAGLLVAYLLIGFLVAWADKSASRE